MDPQAVTVTRQAFVTTIVLNRPSQRNAVDGATAQMLADEFRKFEADDSQRVAVLYGAGGTFCAGADLKALSGPSFRANQLGPVGETDGPMGPSRMQLSKPVIAAISGYAVAGGLELAIWCDLRVADETAVLGVFCRRWGVPLIDGGTVRLPRLIGQSRALDMILTGRPVSAHQALDMGLINRLVPKGHALSEAQSLAAQIAEFPQATMRADRRSCYEGASMPLEHALANEFKLGLPCVREGIRGAARFAQGAGRHGSFAMPSNLVPDPRASGNIMNMSRSQGPKRAVLFDLGGVVCGSPLVAIRKYERDHGFPPGALGKIFTKSDVFARLESGQVSLQELYVPFEAECKQAGLEVDSQALFADMEAAAKPRLAMVDAIKRLRAAGLKVAAVTNNWKARRSAARGTGITALDHLFDQIIESSVVGVRKPDPRIYEIACGKLGVKPQECVFLDDLGVNLRSASKLGIYTIRVELDDQTGEAALAQLALLTGIDLGVQHTAASVTGRPVLRSRM